MFDNGTIVEQGTFKELLKKKENISLLSMQEQERQR
ncbi:Uncharacterised protein [Paenibacillus polymyxa]|uniref:Uncharacterized protein n=1 Tax=Paenibacillus polymyxa TaxID=1406 RepID=A0A378XVF3_PAEPO|nr:Uncharacterised protein [Paenibacillus polymyxa]